MQEREHSEKDLILFAGDPSQVRWDVELDVLVIGA